MVPFGGVFWGMSFGVPFWGDLLGDVFVDPFWVDLFGHLFGCLIVDAFLGCQGNSSLIRASQLGACQGACCGTSWGPSKRVF